MLRFKNAKKLRLPILILLFAAFLGNLCIYILNFPTALKNWEWIQQMFSHKQTIVTGIYVFWGSYLSYPLNLVGIAMIPAYLLFAYRKQWGNRLVAASYGISGGILLVAVTLTLLAGSSSDLSSPSYVLSWFGMIAYLIATANACKGLQKKLFPLVAPGISALISLVSLCSSLPGLIERKMYLVMFQNLASFLFSLSFAVAMVLFGLSYDAHSKK